MSQKVKCMVCSLNYLTHQNNRVLRAFPTSKVLLNHSLRFLKGTTFKSSTNQHKHCNKIFLFSLSSDLLKTISTMLFTKSLVHHVNGVTSVKLNDHFSRPLMHQSIPAVPMPPPPANPWALAFFLKNGQIPRGGDT